MDNKRQIDGKDVAEGVSINVPDHELYDRCQECGFDYGEWDEFEKCAGCAE